MTLSNTSIECPGSGAEETGERVRGGEPEKWVEMYSSACNLNLTIHFLSQHFDNVDKHPINQH